MDSFDPPSAFLGRNSVGFSTEKRTNLNLNVQINKTQGKSMW